MIHYTVPAWLEALLLLFNGHRISVDLDLFANSLEADFMTIITEIKSKGHKFEIRNQSSGMLIAMIENVKVDR